MKRLLVAVVLALVAVLAIGAAAYAATGTTGNGAPSGAHYNLNIIGVDNPKNYSDEDPFADPNNGKRIFVTLNNQGGTSTKILLKEGETFDVLDYNGTDGIASFQLPNPYVSGATVLAPDATFTTAYSVYARALGKPNKSAQMVSCFTEAGIDYCSTEVLALVSHGNNNKFTNVSKELLTVCLDTLTDGNLDGTCDIREYLFGRAGDQYFWQYTNTGLKLAQLRFYQLPSECTVDGCTPILP